MNGLDFPLATACLIKANRRPDKSAGVVYSLELLGACLGAVLASLVLAPIFGILVCCLVAAVGNGVAFGVIHLSPTYCNATGRRTGFEK